MTLFFRIIQVHRSSWSHAAPLMVDVPLNLHQPQQNLPIAVNFIKKPTQIKYFIFVSIYLQQIIIINCPKIKDQIFCKESSVLQ